MTLTYTYTLKIICTFLLHMHILCILSDSIQPYPTRNTYIYVHNRKIVSLLSKQHIIKDKCTQKKREISCFIFS